MTKPCQICGTPIHSDDCYAFMRMKYCKRCAADAKRQKNAEYMRELRRKTREANALRRELCVTQQQEIEQLRAVVLRQREQLRELEKEADSNGH